MKQAIQTAEQWADHFTMSDDGERVCLKNDAPQVLRDYIFALSESLPDDDAYTFGQRAIEALAQADDNATIDDIRDDNMETGILSVYTANLTAWVAGDIHRVAHVDDALGELEATYSDTNPLVNAIWYAQQHMFECVLDTLFRVFELK